MASEFGFYLRHSSRMSTLIRRKVSMHWGGQLGWLGKKFWKNKLFRWNGAGV
jgi:hypothetical protein